MSDTLASEDFVASPDNPVLLKGPPGSWDGGLAFLPHIVIEDGTWYLFYTGQTIQFLTPGKIGFATSTDGVNWTKAECNPILSGDGLGFDAFQVGDSVVFVRDGTWLMYYGGNAVPEANPTGLDIGFAIAPDPCGPWTRMPQPVLRRGSEGEWDAAFVEAGSVVATEEGLVMYYSGSTSFFTGIYEIGRATSVDGINWTKYDNPETTEPPYAESDPVLSVGPVGAWDEFGTWLPDVHRTAGNWEMYYSGIGEEASAIGYATSDDGISWVKSANNPIFTPQDDPVAITGSAEAPHAVDTESARLLYYDYFAAPDAAIGFAISDSDQDDVADNADNCTLVANSDQRDTDGDGFGSLCDADLNNNCFVGVRDFRIFRSVVGTDDADADFNNDGIVDIDDFLIFRPQVGSPPGPSGVPNICDE